MREPYAYTVLVTPTAVNDRKQNSFTIENGKDFFWIKGMVSCDNATVQNGTDLTFGGALCEIEYQSGGQRRLQNAPMPIAHYFGSAGLGIGPIVLPSPIRFAGAGAVTVYLTGQIAGTVNFRLTFIGIHVNPGEALNAA